MKRLAIFLVVTFGLTWGLQISAGIALGTFGNGEASSMVMIVLIAVSMFFPLVGALVANHACKPEERIDLGIKPRIRDNLKYYLAAWFVPAALALLGCVVFFVLNPHLFDPSMTSYLETIAATTGVSVEELQAQMHSMPVMLGGALFAAFTYAPFINMIFGLGEEIGWRGMLFPSLAAHMPVRAAVLVSGIIWGLWHAPVIAMGHNYGMTYAGFPFVGILVMMLACTALGCWLSLLRARTGSVWPCALAHGSFNAVANFGVVFCTSGSGILGPSPLALVAGIPMFVLGVACLVKFRR